jgi:hypothetical protein
VCDECLRGHARARIIDEGDLRLLVCPLPGCVKPLPGAALERLFADAARAADGPAVLARRRQLLGQALVSAAAGLKWCPAAGCGRSVELPAAAKGLAVGVACACGHAFCFGCGAGPHEPASCREWEVFSRMVSERRELGEAESEGWIRANTTRCRRCDTPIQRSLGCNHMRCTRCSREFCYVCGDDWAPVHYQCFRARAAHGTDEGADDAAARDKGMAPAALAALAARWEQERRTRCLDGYASWEVAATSGPAPDEWARLCGADMAALPAAAMSLSAAQKAVRAGAMTMARSYGMEWGMPQGVRHLRARKRLQALREGLERDLHVLAGVLPAPAGLRAGPEDARETVGLAVVVEDRAEVRARLDRLRGCVERQTSRLLAAGRSRGWSASTGNRETAAFLAGEGLAAAGRVVGGLLRGGAWMLGLTGESGPATNPGQGEGRQATAGGGGAPARAGPESV